MYSLKSVLDYFLAIDFQLACVVLDGNHQVLVEGKPMGEGSSLWLWTLKTCRIMFGRKVSLSPRLKRLQRFYSTISP